MLLVSIILLSFLTKLYANFSEKIIRVVALLLTHAVNLNKRQCWNSIRDSFPSDRGKLMNCKTMLPLC